MTFRREKNAIIVPWNSHAKGMHVKYVYLREIIPQTGILCWSLVDKMEYLLIHLSGL